VRPRLRRLPAALLAALLAVSLLVAAACGDDDDEGSSGAGDGVAVRIADKGFAESFIVAQAYAQALNAEGFDADVTSLASTEIADRAIRDGEIDVYPEYVGTAYGTVLARPGAQAPEGFDAQFEAVRTGYEGRGLTALPPAPFNNANEVACTQEAVDQYSIATLSDLGTASPNLVYSANAEHLTRADGLPLLRSDYGVKFKDIRTVDISLRYKPIEDGQAQCVYAFTTDPQLNDLPLVLLDDDKGAFKGLSFQTFPVVNKQWYDGLTEEQRTTFDETLAIVNEGLTDEIIRDLIARATQDQEDPEVIAADYLASQGIVES
jgi:osmoprotectant transport system substrate-binding protein